MAKIDFYLTNIDYIDEFDGNHRGIVRLWGRTKKGENICVTDSTFSSYFWAIIEKKELVKKLKDRILATKIQETKRVAHVRAVSLEKKKHLGEEVYALKIEVNNPKDISSIREDVKKMKGVVSCVETDISLTQRYLIDKNITPLSLCVVEGEEIESNYRVKVLDAKIVSPTEGEQLESPKILAFDIEVYNLRRNPIDDEDPIVMISVFGSGGYQKTILWKKYSGAKKHVEFVRNEAEMIIRFCDIVREFNPDYLVGYFSDGFDLPYLRTRAEKHKIRMNLGSDGSNIRLSRGVGSQTAKIKGISHIDIFKFIRRVMSGDLNLPSYDLDTVARKLLGVGKSGADISKLYKVWDKGGKAIETFCEYNLIDAKRTFQLTENLLPHMNEFVKLCGLPPEEISRMGYGRLVESFILRNLKEFDEIAPNKPHMHVMNERVGEMIEGAFVYQPEAGLYSDIAVFDFKSLYPTIISAHNVCPSTLTDSKRDSNKTPEITFGGKKVNFYFTYKYDGIFPKMIREILVRRNRVKEMLKKNKKDSVLNARQYSLKILANSAYGYLGFAGARWYCKECAASTTAYGRNYIKKLIERAEKEKFKVIYGDTDSIFISLGEKKGMKDAERFLKDVNNELPSLMELEMEGFYPRGIFVMKKGEVGGAKKKYALADEKGEIKIVGFETVRGDWSIIAKEVQREVLKIILIEENVDKAVTYIKDVVEKTKGGKIPVKKMIIKKKLKKEIGEYSAVGPHVSVAKKLKERGESVGAGSEIAYVVQEGKGNIGSRSVPADEAKKYDSEYYVKHQIIPVVDRILSSIGYQKEEIIEDQKQKSLGDFS
tara:strand:+ start:5049 stop:7523 length:2475 start_codon:yes stop_codon:yes gene_type:complete